MGEKWLLVVKIWEIDRMKSSASVWEWSQPPTIKQRTMDVCVCARVHFSLCKCTYSWKREQTVMSSNLVQSSVNAACLPAGAVHRQPRRSPTSDPWTVWSHLCICSCALSGSLVFNQAICSSTRQFARISKRNPSGCPRELHCVAGVKSWNSWSDDLKHSKSITQFENELRQNMIEKYKQHWMTCFISLTASLALCIYLHIYFLSFLWVANVYLNVCRTWLSANISACVPSAHCEVYVFWLLFGVND